MRLPILTLILGLCTSLCSYGQTSPGAEENLSAIPTIPEFYLQELTTEMLEAIAARGTDINDPFFTVQMTADLNLLDWAEPIANEEGIETFQLRVIAKKASLMILYFDEFYLPSGATLKAYTEDGRFLKEYSSSDNTELGKISVGPVFGGSIVLEYKPSKSESAPQLHLAAVAHNRVDDPQARGGATPSWYQASTSCQIDAQCWFASDWCNEISSVGMMLSPTNGGCSGAMIMNTRRDFEPYFLTAFHCIDSDVDGDLSQNEINALATYTFIWNYERSNINCNVFNSPEPGWNSQCGASLVTAYRSSDLVLLQLFQRPDEDWNVSYAGWDNRDQSAIGGASVHHPARDVKKINHYATHTTLRRHRTSAAGFLVHTWKVRWSSGMGEGGSSGAPLFDESGQIMGVCSGTSYGECGSIRTIHYGRFHRAWDNDATLRAALDPLNTGQSTIATDDQCQSDIALNSTGLAWTYSDGIYDAKNTIDVTGSSYLLGHQSAELTAGESVTFSPGFHAHPGAEMAVKIAPCSRGCGLFGGMTQGDGAIDPITELATNDMEITLEGFPNPTDDLLTINYTLPATQAISFTITDISGKQIDERSLSAQEQGSYQLEIDLSAYQSGVYIVTAISGNSAPQTLRVVKL